VLEKFLIDQWMIILVAVTSGLMLVWPMIAGGRGKGTLTTLQATQLINQKDAVIVDIRDQGEYAAGHIMNAKSIPAKVFADRKNDLEKLKSAPIIVSCDTGQRAGTAAQKLREMGFNEVYVLTGGLNAWREAGLPVSK
jgi:rhodanese-related sulfurtransferase